jgi:hypothetical protein
MHGKRSEILAYLQTDCWYPVKAGGRYARTGTKKIDEAIRNGKLRAYTVNHKRLIKIDIDAWIMAGEITRENREAARTDLQKSPTKPLSARAVVAAGGGRHDRRSAKRKYKPISPAWRLKCRSIVHVRWGNPFLFVRPLSKMESAIEGGQRLKLRTYPLLREPSMDARRYEKDENGKPTKPRSIRYTNMRGAKQIRITGHHLRTRSIAGMVMTDRIVFTQSDPFVDLISMPAGIRKAVRFRLGRSVDKT